jgi:uncharacterized protein (DUF433 family)
MASLASERVGGRVCFRGTRVPVNALLDNREDGLSPDEFLEQFEGGVTREQALAVLEFRGIPPAGQRNYPGRVEKFGLNGWNPMFLRLD